MFATASASHSVWSRSWSRLLHGCPAANPSLSVNLTLANGSCCTIATRERSNAARLLRSLAIRIRLSFCSLHTASRRCNRGWVDDGRTMARPQEPYQSPLLRCQRGERLLTHDLQGAVGFCYQND